MTANCADKLFIINDPDRFHIIRKIFTHMLTGQYTAPRLLQIVNNQWGFRTPKGKRLSRSGIYRILNNPFYYGEFEYPENSGHWYKGRQGRSLNVNI